MSERFHKVSGRPLSQSERAYIPAASTKRRPVIVFGKWYPSLSDAARATRNSRQTIHHWLRIGSTRAQYA